MNHDAIAAVNDALDNNKPVLLIGVPGIGKTEILNQMMDARGWHCETLIASGLEPSDVGGLPQNTPEGVVCNPPAYVRRIHAAHAAGKTTALFIDELTTCHPALQAVLLRLIQERRHNDWSLPKDCRIVCAANPPEMAAGGWDISAPLATRVARIEVSPDLDAWAEWNVTQPDTYGIRTQVVAFLKSRPSLFVAFPKDTAKQSEPSPCPRSWHNVCGVRTDTLRAGFVGNAAYAEFLQWKAAADLPTPEDVCTGKASLPTRADARFAVLLSIAALATRDYKTYGKAAWKIIVDVAESALDEALVPARALAGAINTPPPELGKLAPALARITK